MEKNILKSQNLSKHGVKNAVAMATCDTLDAKLFQNLVLHWILVKVATFGRYCLNIKEVLESWNRRGHFPPPLPPPPGGIGLKFLFLCPTSYDKSQNNIQHLQRRFAFSVCGMYWKGTILVMGSDVAMVTAFWRACLAENWISWLFFTLNWTVMLGIKQFGNLERCCFKKNVM